MIMKVFTIYDSKAESYLQPFFMQSKGQAIRAFSELVNDEKHNFGKYPADFTLFELGVWDDSKALFTTYATPVSLGVAVEFKQV
jgi:hypothetical protein